MQLRAGLALAALGGAVIDLEDQGGGWAGGCREPPPGGHDLHVVGLGLLELPVLFFFQVLDALF